MRTSPTLLVLLRLNEPEPDQKPRWLASRARHQGLRRSRWNAAEAVSNTRLKLREAGIDDMVVEDPLPTRTYFDHDEELVAVPTKRFTLPCPGHRGLTGILTMASIYRRASRATGDEIYV